MEADASTCAKGGSLCHPFGYLYRRMHFQAHPFIVPRVALKGRASKRIRVMAQPKFITKKYDLA